jgi:protein-ribulosamine 3-kinase
MSDGTPNPHHRPQLSAAIAGNFPLDESIILALPESSKLLSAHHHRTSAWASTGRIKTEQSDGTQTQYFIKCIAGAHGRSMMEGEYHAMTELYNSMSNFVPKPYTWGKYQGEKTYFFLSEFIDFNNSLPEPNQLGLKLAQLHQTSSSPTGKFGLQVTSYQGQTSQSVAWEKSWTTFFTSLLRHVIELDLKINGSLDNLELLEGRLILHVIPRLIGLLEKDGRSIKPCLVHGDLWEGNIGTSSITSDLYIFDAGAYYAHNEMELGQWRCNYNKIHDRVYTETYLQHFGVSDPKEEWDDRNRMYCIYFNVLYSVNHTAQGTAARQQ